MESHVEPSGSFELRVRSSDEGRWVQLTGELDGGEALRLHSMLDTAGARERVLVDCSELSFVDSMGLRLLVEWHRRLDEVGGQLVICRPSDAVRRLLVATRLDTVMHVDAS